jgi:hypothetical protein
MRKSAGDMCRSTSVGSGITATDAVDVCTRPFDSVLGTLCTLWTPLSNLQPLACTVMWCSASNLTATMWKQTNATSPCISPRHGRTHRNLENASFPMIRLIISLKPSAPHPVSARAAEMGSRRHPFATPTLTQVSPVSCGADRKLSRER